MSNIIGIDVSKASLDCAYLRDPDQQRAKRKTCHNEVRCCHSRCRLRFQPVDATHWLNRSAGVSKFNVSLGLSFSLLATAFSLFW